MSRKDYELIAKALKSAETEASRVPFDADEVKRTMGYVRMEFLKILSRDNPRFDADKFCKAAKS